MSKLKTYIDSLNSKGFTQLQISKEVEKISGEKCTQATISRISSGITRTPNYNIGRAIETLHDKVFLTASTK